MLNLLNALTPWHIMYTFKTPIRNFIIPFHLLRDPYFNHLDSFCYINKNSGEETKLFIKITMLIHEVHSDM